MGNTSRLTWDCYEHLGTFAGVTPLTLDRFVTGHGSRVSSFMHVGSPQESLVRWLVQHLGRA